MEEIKRFILTENGSYQEIPIYFPDNFKGESREEVMVACGMENLLSVADRNKAKTKDYLYAHSG